MMRKIILIAVFLLLARPSLAQNTRMGTYTSPDGVLQVSYMQGWRVGAIEPDLENPENITWGEMPSSYLLQLYHSNPDAEIRFYVVDTAERIPEEQANLDFLQETFEEEYPDIEFTRIQFGEEEALEVGINQSAIDNHSLGLEAGTRRYIFYFGRSNWLISTSLISQDESLDEEFITIAESFRFNGSNRDILSLTGNISITLPENLFRYSMYMDTSKKWESIGVHGINDGEFCTLGIDIIAMDNPLFEFPAEGTHDEYLTAFLRSRENTYELFDFYDEQLPENAKLYLNRTGEEFEHLSLHLFEESLVISRIYGTEPVCFDNYLLMISSVREE
jgi:hypothetical protein